MLVWANVAVFVLQLVVAWFQPKLLEGLLGLRMDGLARGFVWQPITYMFLHGGFMHILFNMLFLWFFGNEVEYFVGSRAFSRLYFLGGLSGAALWLVFNFSSPIPVIGASAAVLACVIAFATLFPHREITLLVFFVLPVTLKAKHLALCVIALDVLPILSQTDTNVAHLAHLGGAALGYLYIKHLGYGASPRWLIAIRSLGTRLRRPSPGQPPRPSSRTGRSRPVSPEEFMRDQVDPILEKIAREGIESLTQQEREILAQARDLMAKKPH